MCRLACLDSILAGILTALVHSYPTFESYHIDGEADPEGDSKELVWPEIGQ